MKRKYHIRAFTLTTMYRVLIVIILVGLSVEVASSSRCNNRKQTWPFILKERDRVRAALDRTVGKIASDIIKADVNIREFCKTNANHHMKETYGMDNYKLSLAVEDFDEDTLSVKVMHKMVYVTADDCKFTYADIRVLPGVVDPTKGKWKYALGELTIYFPYIVVGDVEVEKNCGSFISTNVIVVPKIEESTEMEADIDVRFGDTEFKNSMKDFLTFKNK